MKRAALLLACCSLSAQAAPTRALIVTGGHAYDTAAFNAMWRSFPEVEWTIRPQQHGHEVFEDVAQFPYDALVFYNHQNPGARLTERHKANFRALLERGVGMVVLHHAVAAYPFFPDFEAMAGVKYRSASYYQDSLSTYRLDVRMPCTLAEAAHPLAAGLPAAFTVTDELYMGMAFAPDNRYLARTSAAGAQGPVAWTRRRGNSRVFTTVLGHGGAIFAVPEYRRMLANALAWVRPCEASAPRPECAAVPPRPRRALLFHKQNGYLHADTDSIVALLKADLASRGLPVESTVDSLAFTPSNLARFGAVIFLNTNYRGGPLLSRAQEAAFEDFVHQGGGFAGIHSAVPLDGAAEEAVWPWYARLFGARFKSHPPMRSAPFVVEDPTHMSTRALPARFPLVDEWYAVQANPRAEAGLRVLATVDETGFPAGSGMGGDHPVSWYRDFEGGRTWVTLAGHDLAAFRNPDFLAHVRGGILWSGGWEAGTTSLGGGRRTGTRGPGRERAGYGRVYPGRDGTRLEVRAVDGRFIEARRAGPSAP